MEKFNRLLQNPLLNFADTTITVGQVVGVVTLILLGAIFVLWTARLIVRILHGRQLNQDLVQMMSRAYLIIGFIILGLIVLDFMQIPLTAFAFVSGAIAIGIGFGAQNIINNFISGWILMWERPIKIGDLLEMGELRGKVEAINTRSTRIRRLDGVHMLIPNSYLLENIVTNWTHRDQTIRTSITVGVAYGSPVERVAQLLAQAAKEEEAVLTDPEPLVVFEDFGDNALIFDVYYWIHAIAERDLRITRSNIRFRIDALFHRL